MSDEKPKKKYLSFVQALVLGSAAAIAVAACGDSGSSSQQKDGAVTDAQSADGGVDAFIVVGPLPPPDLPRKLG
jgi:hypothetical protein